VSSYLSQRFHRRKVKGARIKDKRKRQEKRIKDEETRNGGGVREAHSVQVD